MEQGLTEEKTKYCPSCGAMIDYKYATCPACGKPQPPLPGMEAAPGEPKKKNITLAVILSLFVNGLGQVYLGRTRRGVIIMGVTLILEYVLDPYLTVVQYYGLGLILGVIAAIDTYRCAKGQA